jgi:hypothetical protein
LPPPPPPPQQKWGWNQALYTETSSLRTIKIIRRNLNEIVRSRIQLLESDGEGRKRSYNKKVEKSNREMEKKWEKYRKGEEEKAYYNLEKTYHKKENKRRQNWTQIKF